MPLVSSEDKSIDVNDVQFVNMLVIVVTLLVSQSPAVKDVILLQPQNPLLNLTQPTLPRFVTLLIFNLSVESEVSIFGKVPLMLIS